MGGDSAAPDGLAPAKLSSRAARFVVYGMLHSQFIINYVSRLSIPYMVSFISRDLSLTALQSSRLISAFVPGYVATQIPASWVLEALGAKAVLTMNNFAVALLMLSIPVAARHSMTALQGCFFGLGVAQGPFIVAQNVMTAETVPHGPERPWALMAIRQGSNIAKLTASVATPLLCASALTWRRTSTLYATIAGLYGCFWHLLLPTPKRAGSGNSNVPESVSAASATKVPFSWRLLVTKPALACVGSHFSRDFIEFHTLAAWAPLFFNEVHGVALGSVGKYTTGAMAVQVVGKVMVAAWESARLQRGTPTLLIRKQADGLASLLGSFFLFCFSVAPTPGIAAICYIGTLGGHCFDYAAHIPNELEVGGADTGKLGAAINTLCWTVNFLFAQVAAALKQRTGSYKAVLWLPIVFRLLSGFNYQLHASCDTAREHLRKHRGAAANPSTL